MNVSAAIARVPYLMAQAEFFRQRGDVPRAAELIEDALNEVRDVPFEMLAAQFAEPEGPTP